MRTPGCTQRRELAPIVASENPLGGTMRELLYYHYLGTDIVIYAASRRTDIVIYAASRT